MKTTLKTILTVLILSLLFSCGDDETSGGDNPPEEQNGECMDYVDLHGLVYEAHDMFFINAQEGWLAGISDIGNRLLLHTTDGGHNWSIINESPSASNGGYTFENLHFVDSNLGYAVKTINERIYTTDGGVTWTEIPLPTVDGTIISIETGMSVNNNTMIFVVKINPSDSNLPDYEKLFFFSNTTHDYVSGQVLPSDYDFTIGGVNGQDIYYSNSGVINMSVRYNGETMMAHSSDNGVSWSFIEASLGDLTDIEFSTENVGYLTAGMYQWGSSVPFYKTTDTGVTWTLKTAELDNGAGFNHFSFADENNGLATRGLGNSLYKTSDGGDTWQSVSCFTDTNSQLDIATTPIEIYYPSANNGIILTIWQSNDTGNSGQDLYQNRLYFYTGE